MPTNEGFSGVSNCYVFKSRLQEYAQKVGLPTPIYETIKEGPSHEPFFKSTVTVNDIRYESLPGFSNRKAAEQSAAEVALMELAKSAEINPSISQPVHETGLCKNLLQEYAQKMNYAIPLYHCEKDEIAGRVPLFKCTVDVGGIKYIGASAKTKKEAEIKAARTSLLAIQSSASESSNKPIGNTQLTVLPCRKREAEMTSVPEVTANVSRSKKARFKKKALKMKLSGERVDHAQGEITGNLDVTDGQSGSESDQANGSMVYGAGVGFLATGAMTKVPEGWLATDLSERETSDVKGSLTAHPASISEIGQSVTPNFNQKNHGSNAGIAAERNGDTTMVTGIGEAASMVNSSTLAQVGASSAVTGLNPTGETIQEGASQE